MSTESEMKKGLERLLGSIHLAHAAALTTSAEDRRALNTVSEYLMEEARYILEPLEHRYGFKNAVEKIKSQEGYIQSVYQQLRNPDTASGTNTDLADFSRMLPPTLRDACFQERPDGIGYAYDPQRAASEAMYSFGRFNFRKAGYGREFYEFGRFFTERFKEGGKIVHQAALDILSDGGVKPDEMLAPRKMPHLVQNLKIAIRGGIAAERVLRAIEDYAVLQKQAPSGTEPDLSSAERKLVSAIEKAMKNGFFYEALDEILNNPTSERGARFYSCVNSVSAVETANALFAKAGLPDKTITPPSPQMGISEERTPLLGTHSVTALTMRAITPQRAPDHVITR